LSHHILHAGSTQTICQLILIDALLTKSPQLVLRGIGAFHDQFITLNKLVSREIGDRGFTGDWHEMKDSDLAKDYFGKGINDSDSVIPLPFHSLANFGQCSFQ
jgi:hypothetical protein